VNEESELLSPLMTFLCPENEESTKGEEDEMPNDLLCVIKMTLLVEGETETERAAMSQG
jgi:hypothetical protein